MSNAGLDIAIKAAGGQIVRTGVGDKLVIEEMLRSNHNFGGEASGHLIFRDYASTGDGLVAALQILSIMKNRGQPLSALRQGWTRLPQLVTNLKVRVKAPLVDLPEVLSLVSEAETVLKAQGGRVFLRYSGTEPKVRLLLEGTDQAELQHWSDRIMAQLQHEIGV